MIAQQDYFIKVDDRWEVFSAPSLRGAVLQVAEYCGHATQLLTTALGACASDEESIAMYNVFAAYYGKINGVWELGRHVIGDRS